MAGAAYDALTTKEQRLTQDIFNTSRRPPRAPIILEALLTLSLAVARDWPLPVLLLLALLIRIKIQYCPESTNYQLARNFQQWDLPQA